MGAPIPDRNTVHNWPGQAHVNERFRMQPAYAPNAPGCAGKDFAVSIRLIPPEPPVTENVEKAGEEMLDEPFPRRRRLIHPLDEFSLEIFVFNQSPYVRTLEATLPDSRTRSSELRASSIRGLSSKQKEDAPTFMPLQSKLRIGCVLLVSHLS